MTPCPPVIHPHDGPRTQGVTLFHNTVELPVCRCASVSVSLCPPCCHLPPSHPAVPGRVPTFILLSMLPTAHH
ncbi:hypothetical protein E2C01_064623 [Portunus trituberculatus]|uniref:Uncharacterized protein n=1 Tax=Portunus trituberculatus TaxID=210409 RepID=A0A5B7HMD1_PORTR|nr:hypothetical protein [Portunus trituberculatus]